MVTKIKYILLTTGAGVLFCAGALFLYAAFDYDDIYKNANVWYKVSTDELNPGEVVALDMNKGYSACDNGLIYLAVYELDTKEEVMVVFPNGGYWSAPGIDTISIEIQKHFGKLEQDLKNK